MDPRMLDYYNRELQFIREMGAEFAEEHPKIAGRLGLEGLDCADPYVERLLEGFAFLAARVQLKIDAEFPRFTEHLLEIVYPHFLAPTPSMAVVQLAPDRGEGGLVDGFVVPRGTSLRSIAMKELPTACEYVTAHDVALWPIELADAEYLGHPGTIAALGLPDIRGAKAVVRLQLRAFGEHKFNELKTDRLDVHIRGGDVVAARLYEQIFASSVAVVVRPPQRPAPWQRVLPKSSIQPLGFDDAEALLPFGARSFQGYRLLKEYFAFPQRYQFFRLDGLEPAFAGCEGGELEILVMLDRADPALEGALTETSCALYCTPAVNLFAKRADRIHVSDRETEFHVVPDRTRPADFEIYQVTEVAGFETGGVGEVKFFPFYAISDQRADRATGPYYTIRRMPRFATSRQQRYGHRSSYVGSEVFVSLVDPEEAPLKSDVRQLGVTALCTNRDLPLHVPLGMEKTDFTLEVGAPVVSVRCVAGPTRPRPALSGDKSIWRVISHLSLNYLSIADSNEREGAVALRDLLRLYCDDADTTTLRLIDAVKGVAAQSIIRRIPSGRMLAFGPGLEVTLTCDENAFRDSGLFLFGAVVEQFLARYVSMNSFTETVVRSIDRGEVMRWPTRIGRRLIL